jgi:hypothetical protein
MIHQSDDTRGRSEDGRVNLANSREIHVAGAGIWQDVDSAQGIRPLVQVTNLGESQMYAFTT